MSAQKDFAMAVFEVIEHIFPQPNGVNVSIYDDVGKVYIFRFEGVKQQQSDTLSDLAEMAIREVEKWIQNKIARGGGVYYVHPFQAENDFITKARVLTCFNVLQRPTRIEFYADTFRKGVAEIRKQFGVAHG